MVAHHRGINATARRGLELGVQHIIELHHGPVPGHVPDGVAFGNIAGIQKERVWIIGAQVQHLRAHVSRTADQLEGAIVRGMLRNNPIMRGQTRVRVIDMINGERTLVYHRIGGKGRAATGAGGHQALQDNRAACTSGEGHVPGGRAIRDRAVGNRPGIRGTHAGVTHGSRVARAVRGDGGGCRDRDRGRSRDTHTGRACG